MLLIFARPDFVVAQEVKGPSDDQFCFDLIDAQGILKIVKDEPFLEQENVALKDKIQNLQEQLKIKDSLLEIAEQRRQLEGERGEFYKSMSDAQEKLGNKYAEANEKLQKQLDTRAFWDKVLIGVAVVVGVAIGLAF